MAPLLKELSSLEIEPLEIVGDAPGREGFDTVRSQDNNLDTLTVTANDLEVAALLTGNFVINANSSCSPNPLLCCCCVCCCV